jgi:hypothetical protein
MAFTCFRHLLRHPALISSFRSNLSASTLRCRPAYTHLRADILVSETRRMSLRLMLRIYVSATPRRRRAAGLGRSRAAPPNGLHFGPKLPERAARPQPLTAADNSRQSMKGRRCPLHALYGRIEFVPFPFGQQFYFQSRHCRTFAFI